jgi:hypothetical protein
MSRELRAATPIKLKGKLAIDGAPIGTDKANLI